MVFCEPNLNNYQSESFYRGMNHILLNEKGYDDPRWLTFNQARMQKASVKKGEKASVVFFYSELSAESRTVSNSADNERQESLSTYKRFVIKRYYVFNASQCEGLAELVKQQERSWEPCAKAEALIQALNPRIEHTMHDRAFYKISEDKICLPRQEYFKTKEDYYSVLMHEVAHWTGAPKKTLYLPPTRFKETTHQLVR